MRMVEPELPQSSGAPGSCRLPLVPVISIIPLSSRETLAPRAAEQARLLVQSAPVEKLVSFVVPEASALNSA